MSTDSDTPAGTTLDVRTPGDNVSAPAPANEHNRKHWRGVIRTYDRDLLVIGNENFFQTKAATQQALPPNTELVKSLETDSFIEYDLLQVTSGVVIGSAALEEVTAEAAAKSAPVTVPPNLTKPPVPRLRVHPAQARRG